MVAAKIQEWVSYICEPSGGRTQTVAAIIDGGSFNTGVGILHLRAQRGENADGGG